MPLYEWMNFFRIFYFIFVFPRNINLLSVGIHAWVAKGDFEENRICHYTSGCIFFVFFILFLCSLGI